MRDISPEIGGRLSRGVIYDSLHEAVAHVRQHYNSGHGTNSFLHDAKFVGMDFTSVDQAWRALGQPWEEGLRSVAAMMRQLEQVKFPTPYSRKRKQQWSDSDGSEIDLDRYRAADPYWRSSFRKNRRGISHLTVLVDVTASWHIPSRLILWRGVAAIVITKLLEAAGFRVCLWAGRVSYAMFRDGVSFGSLVMLKDYGSPMNLQSLVNAVSGWALRSLWFSMGRHVPVTQNHSLGSPSNVRALVPFVERVAGEFLVIDKVWSLEGAVEIVRESLELLHHKAMVNL